jgi:aspartate kinase
LGFRQDNSQLVERDYHLSNLVIQKFGGSSVASIARIHRVASIIQDSLKRGLQIVAVVSAMGGETNRLDAMAREVGISSGAELDVLLSSGEQVSAALLAMALQQLGIKAASFCGHQVRFLTSSDHQNAWIESVETQSLQQAIDRGIVPVVAGFQGVNKEGVVTTFGRGGSDLTAVALSAALRAQECQIYTDTDGVYTADPRIVSNAQKILKIPLPLMMEYAQAGAKILQPRCLELAIKEFVPVRVLSSYGALEGTLLTPEEVRVSEGAFVQGLATMDGYSSFRLSDLPPRRGAVAYCLAALGAAGLPPIEILCLGGAELFFAGKWELPDSSSIHRVVAELGCAYSRLETGLTKLTVVGCGLTSDSGLFQQLCSLLSKEGVDPISISASSSRIELLLLMNQAGRVARALHEGLIKTEKVIMNE